MPKSDKFLFIGGSLDGQRRPVSHPSPTFRFWLTSGPTEYDEYKAKFLEVHVGLPIQVYVFTEIAEAGNFLRVLVDGYRKPETGKGGE